MTHEVFKKNSNNKIISSSFIEFDDENCRLEKSEEKDIIDEWRLTKIMQKSNTKK